MVKTGQSVESNLHLTENVMKSIIYRVLNLLLVDLVELTDEAEFL